MLLVVWMQAPDEKKHCERFRKYVTAEHFFEVNLDYPPPTHTPKKKIFMKAKKNSVVTGNEGLD